MADRINGVITNIRQTVANREVSEATNYQLPDDLYQIYFGPPAPETSEETAPQGSDNR